jgi:hypothetical protein
MGTFGGEATFPSKTSAMVHLLVANHLQGHHGLEQVVPWPFSNAGTVKDSLDRARLVDGELRRAWRSCTVSTHRATDT